MRSPQRWRKNQRHAQASIWIESTSEKTSSPLLTRRLQSQFRSDFPVELTDSLNQIWVLSKAVTIITVMKPFFLLLIFFKNDQTGKFIGNEIRIYIKCYKKAKWYKLVTTPLGESDFIFTQNNNHCKRILSWAKRSHIIVSSHCYFRIF